MFLYSLWLELPLATRATIAHTFGISKKHPTHVDSNRIVSDGYEIKDVESALTLTSLQDYLGTTESSLPLLWQMMIDKVEGRVSEAPKEIAKEPEVIPPPIFKKKPGRPKKTGK